MVYPSVPADVVALVFEVVAYLGDPVLSTILRLWDDDSFLGAGYGCHNRNRHNRHQNGNVPHLVGLLGASARGGHAYHSDGPPYPSQVTHKT